MTLSLRLSSRFHVLNVPKTLFSGFNTFSFAGAWPGLREAIGGRSIVLECEVSVIPPGCGPGVGGLSGGVAAFTTG